MTNTIPNVPRELLERCAQYTPTLEKQEDRARALSELRAMLSAPSPAGVDGLEVVAWQLGCQTMGGDVGYVLSWNKSGAGVCSRLNGEEHERALCRLSDAQAIIDGLRGEVEVMTQNANNYSRMFEECAEERDQQAQRIGELEGLLRDSAELIKHGVFEDGYCCCGSSVDSHGLGDGHSPVDALAYHAGQVCERIDAALAEIDHGNE